MCISGVEYSRTAFPPAVTGARMQADRQLDKAAPPQSDEGDACRDQQSDGGQDGLRYPRRRGSRPGRRREPPHLAEGQVGTMVSVRNERRLESGSHHPVKGPHFVESAPCGRLQGNLRGHLFPCIIGQLTVDEGGEASRVHAGCEPISKSMPVVHINPLR